MHCHCGTNYRAPRWAFTDPCKPKVRPGVREESASPAWLAAPAMNARDIMKLYIWRLDTGCGPTLYRKFHSHNTLGIRRTHSRLNPPGPHGGLTLDVDPLYIGSFTATTHQEKGIIILESNPSRGTVLPAPHGKGNKCNKNVKYDRTDALSLWHQQ